MHNPPAHVYRSKFFKLHFPHKVVRYGIFLIKMLLSSMLILMEDWLLQHGSCQDGFLYPPLGAQHNTHTLCIMFLFFLCHISFLLNLLILMSLWLSSSPIRRRDRANKEMQKIFIKVITKRREEPSSCQEDDILNHFMTTTYKWVISY